VRYRDDRVARIQERGEGNRRIQCASILLEPLAVIGDDPDLTMAAEEIEAMRAAYGARSKVVTGTTTAVIEDAAKVADLLHIAQTPWQ